MALRKRKKLTTLVTDESGQAHNFYTYRLSPGCLCKCIASMPGVEFTRPLPFFHFGKGVLAEFRFKGHDFQVERVWTDTHVLPKELVSADPEIVEIQEFVEENAQCSFVMWVIGLLKRKKK